MQKRPVLIVGMLVAVTAFVLTIWLVSDKPEEQTSTSERPEIDEAHVTATNIELVQGSKGALQWKMRADRARYNTDQGLVIVDEPQLTAYFGKDRQQVFVRARQGDLNEFKDNLTLRDRVDGRFGMFALSAEKFNYVGEDRKVYISGGVTVSRPDLTVNATLVEISLDDRVMTAEGGVSAMIIPQTPFIKE